MDPTNTQTMQKWVGFSIKRVQTDLREKWFCQNQFLALETNILYIKSSPRRKKDTHQVWSFILIEFHFLSRKAPSLKELRRRESWERGVVLPQPISLRCQTEYRIRPTVGLRKVLDGSFGRRIGHSQHPRKLEDPILEWLPWLSQCLGRWTEYWLIENKTCRKIQLLFWCFEHYLGKEKHSKSQISLKIIFSWGNSKVARSNSVE